MWKDCTLGDVIILKRGYDLPDRLRENGKVPVVSSSGISGVHSVAKVKGPGVVTGRYGTLGEVFFIKDDFWPLNTALYVVDFKGNDRRFISYWLTQQRLGSQNAAGAVPGVNRNHLHQLDVRIPTVDIQQQIASILSAYDDLIENNTRRIAILEEMARRIFEEWFVHFRAPGCEGLPLVESAIGPIPRGWQLKLLPQVTEVTYGFPFKSKRFNPNHEGIGVIRIRDIPTGQTQTFTTEDTSAKYRVHDTDVLIGMDGNFHMCLWPGGEALLNQRVARLIPCEGHSTYWLFLAVKPSIKRLERTIVGTAVAHLSARDMDKITVAVPPVSLCRSATTMLDQIARLEITLKKQNANLRAQRDLLLPKLISGEIDVSAASTTLKEAAE